MSDQEKIAREHQMLMRDLQGMRQAYLLRIIRNKRLPIAERYAACMHHSPDLYDLKIDLSDESILGEINQCIHDNSEAL